jgi:hypothetical protein
MQRILWAFLVLGLCCSLQLTTGCGGKDTKKAASHKGSTESTEDETPATKTALAAKGWATLKGKVTLDGTPPAKDVLAAIKNAKDAGCHEGAPLDQKIDQTWIVSDDKEVANVVVWVHPPKDKYFKIKDEDKDRSKETKVLHQPHCAFLPHVLDLYPYYFNGEELKPTNQKFVVKDDAGFPHNTQIEQGSLDNPTWNSGQMVPGSEKVVPNRKPQDTPLNVKCDIHSWMRAKIWVFDHPYHAVTNEKGEYEIKNIPAGAKVYVVGWHEGAPGEYALPEAGPSREGQEITLMEGDNTLNFKVKRK